MTQVTCRFAFAIDAPSGTRCPRHRHHCTEMVVVLSGDGVLHQGRQHLPYRGGTAFVYQPGVEHWIEQHRAGRHLCLGIVGGATARLVAGVRPVTVELERVVDLLLRELAGPREAERLDLLAGLAAAYFAAGPATEESRLRRADDRLAQAEALLRAHLDRPLSAGDCADALFISPGYLRNLFHRAYGHGPMHRLLELRIVRAKELLAAGTLSVAEVATRCGFADPSHFSRAFSRLAGVPPRHWRSAAQAKQGRRRS